MERVAGIEPALSGRKHDILPLNYTRILQNKSKHFVLAFIYYNLWWAGKDSNLRTQMRTDLQSAAFSHSATYPYI